MKIGILTYFDGINYGAFAQVYALQSRLIELGFDAEVIAYKDLKHKINEYKSLFLTLNYKILNNNIDKLRIFRSAQQKLNTTSSASRLSHVVNMKFDTIILGSDEIWNFNNDLFGLNLIYFGEGINQKTNVISYAASFGSVSKDDVIPKEVVNSISKLSDISVRDDNSIELLSKFFKDVRKVLDPTFLYDFEKELNEIKIDGDYLLFYGISLQGEDQNFIQEMISFAKSKGLRLISVGYHHDWADENYVNIHPFSWLNYIKNANYVVTNMFHGTVFSIKFNKRFITIASKRRKNKVGSLLREFSLENRLCSSSDIYKDFSEKITSEISYELINSKINQLKKLSESFLTKSLTK